MALNALKIVHHRDFSKDKGIDVAMLYKTFLLLCVGVAWRGVGVDSNQLKIAQPRPKRLYFNLKVQKDISHQRESPFLCNGQTIKSRLSFEAKIESFY